MCCFFAFTHSCDASFCSKKIVLFPEQLKHIKLRFVFFFSPSNHTKKAKSEFCVRIKSVKDGVKMEQAAFSYLKIG